MSQNTSSAVMQQRREAKDSLDLFPTPPWATRALLNWIEANAMPLAGLSCWEPAAGKGDMVRPLRERFQTVIATDCYEHAPGILDKVHDYLMFGEPYVDAVDWIITNPPFRLAAEFIEQSFRPAQCGIAMLVRIAFLEGIERYKTLFSTDPPNAILQFTERVAMVRGRIDEDASSATAYCWLVWLKNPHGRSTYPEFHWLPPCRRKLERPHDYAEAA